MEVRRAVEKEKAGAKYFLTQPVYDDKDIESLKYIKSFLSVPILFGVMPLVSIEMLILYEMSFRVLLFQIG